MGDNQLSRRKVLGALATAGGAGAIVGTGTGALFSDEETFTDDGIRASTSVAGVVDLELEVDVLGDGTGVIYDLTLPGDVNNNPSYIWFRTGCPDPLELGCATEIEVRIDCDGGGDADTVVASGLARDVLNALRNGTLLCGGDAACLELGETRTLEIEITDNPGSGYDGPDGPLEFDLEFYGEQCRYNTGTENPFDDPGECEECPESDAGSVSWIAFCAEDADDPVPTDNTELTDSLTAVDWETEEDVDYVAIRTGNGQTYPYTVYDYSSGTKISGTAKVGDKDADFRGPVSDVDGYHTGDANSNPCEFAKAALVSSGALPEDSGDFSGGSTKLNEEGGSLEEES
ncbi:MAG: hypothetical protein V5A30_09080 [Haloarculaceae archaeon]